MPKRPRILRSHRKIIGQFDVVNPRAAGIDAGAEQHYVSVPEECCSEPVRTFGTMTKDLYALAEWLSACGISTVAIEATGVYWMPLYEVLEERGLSPRLIDSRSIGRRNKKTDVLDCQWIRQLHTHGLLDAAFRPPAQMLPLRAVMRQRKMLIERAADHVRQIQKALELMNVKLHRVISDTTGVTGMRIIRSIVAGKHDPKQLAALRDRSCRASEQEFLDALSGNYRREHLFCLSQQVESFDLCQRQIAACDQELETILTELTGCSEGAQRKAKSSRRKNQLHFHARELLGQLAGVDLTAVDGFETATVLAILAETGTDMSYWPSGKHFAGWLALSPNTCRTGGKPITTRGATLHPNRAAQAFRLAAQTLERARCALGAFFRRIKSRHGRPIAIKATAHKLARIFYAMLKNRTEYRKIEENEYEQRYQHNALRALTKRAAAHGYALVPLLEVH